MSEKKEQPTGLALLREPFPAHQISKLPKPTKKQTEEVKADFRKGIRCQICGAWHHPDVVHLDYVGHAALTDRLLDADPAWSWEPLTIGADGCPVIDRDGGLWIRLTVCGVTRLGYGDAQGKTGGDAMKERIGDALRNAAMRFGAALDLWHKGDLHLDDDDSANTQPKPESSKSVAQSAWESMDASQVDALTNISMDVIALLSENRVQEAVKYIDDQGLSTDEKAALWSRFDSKQRSAMKKVKQPTPQEYAEQA